MDGLALFPSMTIRKKILLLLMAVLLPVCGGIVASGLEQRRNAIEAATSEALVLVHSLAAQQEQIAIGTRQMLSTLALLPGVQQLDADFCNDLFCELAGRYPYYANITMVLPNGDLIASSVPFPPGTNYSERKYLKDAIRTRDFSAGEYVIGKLTNFKVINYSCPVWDPDGNIIAFVIAGFKLDDYSGFLKKVKLPNGFIIGIIDHAGVRLCRLPEDQRRGSGTRVPEEAMALMAGENEQGTFRRMGPDGIQRVYAFKQLRLRESEKPYLYMVAGLPKEEIMWQANLDMFKNLAILGLAAGLAMLLAWIVGYFSLIKPISRLTIASRKFGSGELDTRTHLPHTPDELGQLAASFDEMAGLLELRDAGWKQAEKALEDSREQLANIIDFLPDPTFVIDGQGKLISWNRAMEEMTGISAADMLGKGDYEYALPFYRERRPMLVDLVHGEYNPEFEARFSRIEKKGSGLLVSEIYIPILGEKGLYLFATACPLHDSSGEIIGAIESIRDITEMKHAQLDKEKLESQLRQAQKMEAIGTLAGGIAHDFNNILSAIIGYTELALIRAGSIDKNYMQQVLGASLRAKDLVQKILSFSRVKKSEGFMPIEVVPLINESLKLLRASLPSTIDIRLKIETQRSVILGDATEIHQLLINLCTNAAQAMEEDAGALEISLSDAVTDERAFPLHLKPGEFLRLTVSDTGRGISPENLDRIFEPYFTTKQVGKGSGLGLAMVHGIVERHKGAIYVYSTPGKGTTFSVYLPRHDDDAAVQDDPASPVPGGAERILFVDDEPMLAELGKQMLEQLGYSVVAETNSVDALELFGSNPDQFELVITDYTMPNMTGAALTREVARIRPDVPVILCSGFADKMTEVKERKLGISAFIMKPLNRRTLAETIRQVLDGKKGDS